MRMIFALAIESFPDFSCEGRIALVYSLPQPSNLGLQCGSVSNREKNQNWRRHNTPGDEVGPRELLPGSDFETLATFGLWPDWHKTEVL